MKTLLVQDDAGDKLLPQLLRAVGYEVATCLEFARARERVQSERFGLVLVDAGIAEARDLCAWIRAEPLGAEVFILAGLLPQELTHLKSLLTAGANDVYLKPWDQAGLQVRLAAAEQQIRQRHKWKQVEDLLNTRAQQQVAIAALGQCALSEDLPTVIDLVSRFAMHTMEVEFCSLMEIDENSENLKCTAGLGWRQGHVGSTRPLPGEQSLTGQALFGGEDVIIERLSADSRLSADDQFLCDHGIVSGLSVAVKGKKKILGLLGAFTARLRQFSEDDLHFLQGLANVLGATIERKRSEAEIEKQQSQVQHLQRLETVGQLAAGLAHDYNNVLTIIHGHITLVLTDEHLPSELGDSLKIALDAVERAANLTRQLLTFSRREVMEPGPLDLNSVITNVTKLLDRILGEQIRLQFEPSAGLPSVEADAGMLEQVIINLAVNARDAMPKGGKLLVTTQLEHIEEARVRQNPEARPGEFVCLTVRDTGCGMDEATLRRIFEPFFTTKAPGKGTGLGLATVYGIVKQHRGWVEVESEIGQGTSFRILLPSQGKPNAAPTSAAPETVLPGGDETILLVEDEPRLRDVARFLLEQLGYQVVEAGSGMEALRAWAKHKDTIDVLLTDLVMPDGLTGFDLAQRLKTERAGLKVICTSGYDVEKLGKDLPADRSFHFLQKPYRTEALARIIRQALKGETQV